MLVLEGLSRRYGQTVALDGLSLDVPEGEVVGFVGPNGAGKTTAMRIALGVLEADAGEVLWRGEPATREVQRGFGYMPEERGLVVWDIGPLRPPDGTAPPPITNTPPRLGATLTA